MDLIPCEPFPKTTENCLIIDEALNLLPQQWCWLPTWAQDPGIYHTAKNNNLSIPWVAKMATEAEVSRGSPQWQHTTPKSDDSHPPAHLIIFPLTNLL
jgi:hypothetical protein